MAAPTFAAGPIKFLGRLSHRDCVAGNWYAALNKLPVSRPRRHGSV